MKDETQWCIECERQPDSLCIVYEHAIEAKWPNGDPLAASHDGASGTEPVICPFCEHVIDHCRVVVCEKHRPAERIDVEQATKLVMAEFGLGTAANRLKAERVAHILAALAAPSPAPQQADDEKHDGAALLPADPLASPASTEPLTTDTITLAEAWGQKCADHPTAERAIVCVACIEAQIKAAHAVAPQETCDYQGRAFGATYEDATCIDGFLWDLDSCDEPGGALTHGGDIPCPKCNRIAHLEGVIEELREQLEIADGRNSQ